MDCTQLVLFVLLLVVDGANAQDVALLFQGERLANHGFLTRGSIGEAYGDTVMCATYNTACCSSAETGDRDFGNWFFPNGSAVLSNSTGTQFYMTRGLQVVRLHRRGGGVSGIYHCRIPDASGENHDLYVGLYTTDTGRPMITSIDFTLTSELNAQTPTFTLTCISEGGPVERADWVRATTGWSSLQDGSTYSISGPTVVDAESAIYHHTLTVTGRLPDTYTCQVLSVRRPTAGGIHLDTMSADIVAADPPTMVSAEQVGSTTTVRVAWTPPTGGATVTGYRIYYTGCFFKDVGNGGATEDTITLQMDGTYTITIVALSQHLPSALSNSVTVRVVTVPIPVITMAQPASPTSITVVWMHQGDVDFFEIAFEHIIGQCPSVEDSGGVTVNDGTTSQQTVMGLQEFSTYVFTITAIDGCRRSISSGSASATTEQAAPSGAPASVRAVAVTSTSITVAWDPVNCIDRNSEITQYVVRHGPESIPDGRQISTVPGTGDAGGMYTISPLTPFTSYSIQMAAVNMGGQIGEFSDAIVVATEQDAPSQVRNLQATPQLITIDVFWSEPETLNGDITAYEVYYQQQEEQERELRNITDTCMTSAELNQLRPETNYTISVIARTIAGPGEEESITVTTSSISQVEGLVAISSITSIAVSWSISGGSFGDITAYEVYYHQQGEERELRNITDICMTSAELNQLRPETTYTISVRAHTIAGPGEEESITVMTSSISQVEGLVANSSITSIAVSWSTSGGSFGDITTYEVYYQQQGEQERELRNITDTSVNSTELTGLRPETTYTISVIARTIAGPGEEESIMATTQSIPPVQNIRIFLIPGVDTPVYINWDAIGGASHYIVYYSPVLNRQRQAQADETETTFPADVVLLAIIGNLTPGVEYQFQVAAVVEVYGETFSGERSQLSDSSRVVVGTPASEEKQGSTAAALAGSVVASAIFTALLYTVILILVVVVVVKHRQSTSAVNNTQAPHSTDIPLKERSAYGEFNRATTASGADEEGIYEHVI